MERKPETKHRAFLPWRDATRDQWLSGMARDGWVLNGVTRFGTRYEFMRSRPGKYAVCERVMYKLTKKRVAAFIGDMEKTGAEYVCHAG